MSKEIAILLSISIHTVNRHRQNILSKLKADTSIEACRNRRIYAPYLLKLHQAFFKHNKKQP